MPDPKSTSDLYDAHAARWARRERVLLSDFTARPRVVEELGPLEDARVLDLGCGEGYVARLVAEAGASHVLGVDSSAEMIARARASIPHEGSCQMAFEVTDATRLEETFLRIDADIPGSRLNTSIFDRVMAVFLFNYLTRDEMTAVLRVARDRLVVGGRLVFTVPHPCFPYMRQPAPPFYFETEGQDYFAGTDRTYEGRIWPRDGAAVPVRCVHKTWADYFTALAEAGFERMPKVVELHVTDEHLALDPAFFEPLRGYPLHVLFRVEVP
jgi:SAM-dependent methyltransferase